MKPCRIAFALLLASLSPAYAIETIAVSPLLPLSAAGVNAPEAPSDPVGGLPATADGYRLSGERDERLVILQLPPPPAGLSRFRIVYRSAVSVMPEGSQLSVELNGRQIAHSPLRATGELVTLDMDVPHGLVVPGANLLRLGVEQRHRVDCSLDATYELVTEIDAAKSGMIGATLQPASLSDLRFLPLRARGGGLIRLILPDTPDPQTVSAAANAIARVALAAGLSTISISDDPAASLDIAVGTRQALAAILPDASTVGDRPALVRGANGRPTLVVTAADPASLAAVAASIPAIPSADGSPLAREKQSADGVSFENETRTFASFGVRTEEFNGRLWRASFPVYLPRDAYLADYDEAEIAVNGGYISGLDRKARIVVRINGSVAGGLSLDNPEGALFADERIHIPLSAFKAGRNRVEITAELPTLSDKACDALANLSSKPRFFLSDASTLRIPRLARARLLPDLSTLSSEAADPSRATILSLPHPRKGEVAAAITLIANLALDAGKPIDATIRFGEIAGAHYIVGSIEDLPDETLVAIGLDSAQARSSAGAPPENPITGSVLEEKTDIASRWQVDHDGRSIFGASLAWARTTFRSAFGAATLAMGVSIPESVALAQETSAFIGQFLVDGEPVTVLAATREPLLTDAVAGLTSPAALQTLRGRLAFLDARNGSIETFGNSADRLYRTDSFSVSNERLIAAGWFTAHAPVYAAMLLGLALLLGAATSWVLSLSRRKA